MHTVIRAKLNDIEQEYNITILYAAVHGSRAYGLATEQSDYDIRFIYKRNPHEYVKLYPEGDTIQVTETDLDIVGWDIRKACALMLKGNVSPFEWINSPEIFIHNLGGLTVLSPLLFKPYVAINQYHGMANTIFKKANNNLNVKSALYVIRCVLCCNWIHMNQTMPPLNFDQLVHETCNPSIIPLIDDVAQQRFNNEPFANVLTNSRLIEYITSHLTFFDKGYINTFPPHEDNTDIVNDYIISTIFG